MEEIFSRVMKFTSREDALMTYFGIVLIVAMVVVYSVRAFIYLKKRVRGWVDKG